MIDCHIHVVPPNLLGVGSLAPVLRENVESVSQVLTEQMKLSGTRMALAMGSWPDDRDPLGINKTLEIAKFVPNLKAIGILDPIRSAEPAHLKAVERLVQSKQVVAFKVYLGYIHHYASDSGYYPYYEMAARYRIPVFFHTGDTFSPYAKLKYAHPLTLDEVAVDFPNTRFVLCHLGNPWTIDAAELIYKNLNVWADLSGMWVSSGQGIESESQAAERAAALDDIQTKIRTAFRYAERPTRFLYGTDWPLISMRPYAEMIAGAIPQDYHSLVFEENTQSLFLGELK
ncbi:MAG: amidohydrolase family protein [Gemmataceae bacterium]|jgi:predicted TIM-barrel fold metal-dependent hydrolase|nr:amidohydrolase family protein [Gemmataceae bacterium]